MINKRGELVWDQLIPWIIAVAVLFIVLLFYGFLSGKLGNYAEVINGIRRFFG
jgi:hypothetical protein